MVQVSSLIDGMIDMIWPDVFVFCDQHFIDDLISIYLFRLFSSFLSTPLISTRSFLPSFAFHQISYALALYSLLYFSLLQFNPVQPSALCAFYLSCAVPCCSSLSQFRPQSNNKGGQRAYPQKPLANFKLSERCHFCVV
jgi:hypothetical protein